MGSESPSKTTERSGNVSEDGARQSEDGDTKAKSQDDDNNNNNDAVGPGKGAPSDAHSKDEPARPPLPDEAPPGATAEDDDDDGWQPVWDDAHQAYYFYNRFSGLTTWTNPRVPEASGKTVTAGVGGDAGVEEVEDEEGEVSASASASASALGDGSGAPPPPPSSLLLSSSSSSRRARPHGGYDPSIHGDYDPTADYAQQAAAEEDERAAATAAAAAAANNNNTLATDYGATGTFNRFTGKWQAAALTPDKFNDESKSRRQMSAFFDVDAAANSHDGKSLKAERSGKKLSKKEVKAFKDKRRERKEEKRRAWLRD